MTDTNEGRIGAATRGGLDTLVLENRWGRAEVALFGGHVLSWVPAAHPREVLYLSPRAALDGSAPIRGGIPVCWPWFGAHPADPSAPSHGFARRTAWAETLRAVLPDGRCRVGLRLTHSGHDPHWPHRCRLDLVVTLGEVLEVAATTAHLGAEPARYTMALHSYFDVADVAQVHLDGLDGVAYQDDVDGGSLRRQQGPVGFDGEVDRVYLSTVHSVRIADGGRGRVVEVSKEGSASTVVWNPGPKRSAALADMPDDGYARMVCVETTNAGDDGRVLAPGQCHRVVQRLRVYPA